MFIQKWLDGVYDIFKPCDKASENCIISSSLVFIIVVMLPLTANPGQF